MRNNFNLQVFENKEFGSIRVIDVNGEPWWVLKDVCTILGLSNPSMIVERLDEDERAKFNLGRQGEANIINESGLYAVILRSDKLNAKAFRKWVTSEILPSIRKYGIYATDKALDEFISNPDSMIEVLETLKAERKRCELLEDVITAIVPKAEYCDNVLQCKNAFPITAISKEYGLSAVKFNRLLKELGVQFKVGKVWVLKNKFANQGFTVTKTYFINETTTDILTCWTEKGRKMLYDLLAVYGIYPEREKILNYQDESEWDF